MAHAQPALIDAASQALPYDWHSLYQDRLDGAQLVLLSFHQSIDLRHACLCYASAIFLAIKWHAGQAAELA